MSDQEEEKCVFKSPVDVLLEKDDCSVELLLDEPSTLQECKSQRPRLMELFVAAISFLLLCSLFFFCG